MRNFFRNTRSASAGEYYELAADILPTILPNRLICIGVYLGGLNYSVPPSMRPQCSCSMSVYADVAGLDKHVGAPPLHCAVTTDSPKGTEKASILTKSRKSCFRRVIVR